MTRRDNRMRLAARVKGMAKCLSGWLLVFSTSAALGQTGLVLPPQALRVVTVLTTLTVTNTASENNIPGQQNGPVVVTNRLTFSYGDRNALLGDGWSFMARTGGTNRNTEITNPANGLLVDYNQTAHPGSIIIPCDLGDMWQINDVGDSPLEGPVVPNGTSPPAYNTRHLLTRALTPNWTNIDLTFTFHGDTDTQQAGIGLYQDDDNFVFTSIGYSNVRGSHTNENYTTVPGPREFYVWEYNGVLPTSAYDWLRNDSPHSHPYNCNLTYTHTLRLSRTNLSTGLVQAYWSPYADLDPWADVGEPAQVTGYEEAPRVVNPRIAIWTGCAPPAIPGAQSLVLNQLEVISIETAPTLLYSLLNPPAGATIDANGVITWTPSAAQGPGTYTITTIVRDNGMPVLSATNSFNVVVNALIIEPVLPSLPDVTANALTILVVNNGATRGRAWVSQPATNTILFTYADRAALLADGWSFLATLPNGTGRNSENTNLANGAVISYDQATHPGVLRIPCDMGDLWGSANNNRNALFRSLPSDWLSLQLALSLAPFTNFHQAHLCLYQNDDNYLQVGMAFNNGLGGEGLTMDLETSGSPNSFVRAASNLTAARFRLDRSPTTGVVAGSYSPNGTNWTVLGVTNQNFANPRLAVWVGGSPSSAPALTPNADLQRLDMVVVTNVPVVLSYTLVNPPVGAAIDANGVITWDLPDAPGPTTNVLTTVVSDNGSPPLRATNSFSVVVLPPPWPVLHKQPARVVDELATLLVTNTAIDGALTVSQVGTNTILFNYANRDELLADGWSFVGANARNTEITGGAGAVDYSQATHPRVLNIPCDQGDLWGSLNNTRNTLFRSLPADWRSVRLALTFAPVTANYQQVHLGLYQDDDNYVQMGAAYNDQDSVTRYERFTMDQESGGIIATPVEVPTSNTNLYFRLDKNPTNSIVTCYYSYDGANWPLLGATNVTFTNPRLMIWAGGSDPAYAYVAVMGVQRLDIIGGTPVPTALSYALLNPPPGASIDGNGVITWMPGEMQGPSTNSITTVVTDNGMAPLSATNTFVVVVNEVNTPPVLPTQMDRTLTSRQTLLVTNTANDADFPSNNLSYQLMGPTNAAIDTNGIITWTPLLTQAPSTNLFKTVVTDWNPWALNNQQLSATNSFTVTVLAPPQPPAIKSVTMSKGAVVITWDCAIGSTYRLQYKDDLAQINWLDLLPDVAAAGHTLTTTNAIGASPSRFFRVLLLP